MSSVYNPCLADVTNQTNYMKPLVTTLSILALATTLSFAQEKPAGPPPAERKPRPTAEEIFKKLDTNNDGVLSLEEFKAGPMGKKDPAKAEEIYKKMDTKNDGKVTLEEFKAFHPLHRGPHGPGGPPGPPPAPPANPPTTPPAGQ